MEASEYVRIFGERLLNREITVNPDSYYSFAVVRIVKLIGANRKIGIVLGVEPIRGSSRFSVYADNIIGFTTDEIKKIWREGWN